MSWDIAAVRKNYCPRKGRNFSKKLSIYKICDSSKKEANGSNTSNNIRKFKKVSIGIFLGRIANFINGELYGKVSTLPWAIIFPHGGNIPRHPSQIYEAILEGIVLFLLINYFALKKKLLFKTGYVSGLFLIFYSIVRIFSEFFREPDIHLGLFFNYFSLGVLLSLVTLIAGLSIILSIKKNEQNN